MDLAEIQKAVLGVIQQPLTPSEGMRKRTLDGRPVKKIVDQVIKPNDRLTSFERLEIYNRVYWFRLISSFMEDFPGLRAILGDRSFEKEEKGKKYHRIERAYGSFARSFSLPEEADAQKVSAEFKEGVLHIRLPKSEKAKPKSIQVKIN